VGEEDILYTATSASGTTTIACPTAIVVVGILAAAGSGNTIWLFCFTLNLQFIIMCIRTNRQAISGLSGSARCCIDTIENIFCVVVARGLLRSILTSMVCWVMIWLMLMGLRMLDQSLWCVLSFVPLMPALIVRIASLPRSANQINCLLHFKHLIGHPRPYTLLNPQWEHHTKITIVSSIIVRFYTLYLFCLT